MHKGGWVYILTNKYHTVLYTGVTSNLVGRLQDHRSKVYTNSFTARYNVNKLVYYQLFESIVEAIMEEKRIKGGSRSMKINLIESFNPGWDDIWALGVSRW